MSKINEKILLYRVRVNKDASAFGLIYDQYVDKIFRFILFKISHRQETEDLVSEVFLKVWQYLVDEEKEIKSLSGLIYTVARTSVIDWYRSRAQRKESALEDVDLVISATEAITEKISANQDNARLLQKIKLLKQDYQELIILKYLDDLSYGEIATIVNKNPIAVRVALHRAMKKLKEIASDGVVKL